MSCNICLSGGECLEDSEDVTVTDTIVIVYIKYVESKLLEQILCLHQVFYLLEEARKVDRSGKIEDEAKLLDQEVRVSEA